MVQPDVSHYCYIVSTRNSSIFPGLAARTCQANIRRVDFTAAHIAPAVFPTFPSVCPSLGGGFAIVSLLKAMLNVAGIIRCGLKQGGRQMDLTSLLVQAVSGAVGGSAAGAAAKQYSLGTLGNAIAGAVGGGVVGQLLGTFAGPMIEGWIGNIAGGAIGGVIITLLAGVIRNMTAK
jgi:hypothetical protein